jgi:hypothetical protein
MEAKQRDSKIINIIESLNQEYDEAVKNDTNTIILADKFNGIVSKINEKIITNCANQIAELNKYANVQTDTDGNIQINKLLGHEALADNALVELEKCQINYTQSLLAITSMAEYTNFIVQNQTELCIDDCEKKTSFSDDKTLKDCIRNCYNFSVNFTNKATSNMISNMIDNVDKQLNLI